MSSVHGGEFEGIVGTVNLISVIETGKDLRGKEWPENNGYCSKTRPYYSDPDSQSGW